MITPDFFLFIAIVSILLWFSNRLKQRDQQDQVEQRSTQDILLSIEDKLDKFVSIQKAKSDSDSTG